MKTILRNFLSTLRCFKLASGLNILGLSVAFAAFIVILMQVSYERGFDKGYPEQVYRVEIRDSIRHSVLFSRPMCDVLLDGSPAIKAGTMHTAYNSTTYLSVEKNGSREAYKEELMNVYPDEADVFGYELTEGTEAAFDDHTKLVFPQSLARKLFGNEPAVGRIVTFEDQAEADGRKSRFEIGAVYKDFPANSSVSNTIKQQFAPEENKNAWGNWNYNLYVTLYPGSDPAEAARQMTERYNSFGKPDWAGAQYTFILQPLQEAYYDMTAEYDYAPKGNRATMNLLLAISLLVIGVAAVNFVNFATSLTPLRIRNINIRKVLGSSVAALRAELVIESVGIALLAFGLALLWVFLLSDTGFDALISGDISFSTYKGVIFLAGGVALAVGLLAGLYPAFYTTSFPPALVLKGSFGLSPRGRKLRTALIGFQFVVSLALIVAAMFLQIQNRFLRNMDTGMNKDNIAIVTLSRELAETGRKTMLVSELKADASVEDVAFAMTPIGTSDLYMNWGRKTGEGQDIHFDCFPVSWNFCQVMGLQIAEGRDFNEEDQTRNGIFIMNQTAMKTFHLTLDDRIEGHTGAPVPVAGVVKDFNYASLRNTIGPMCLYQFGREPWTDLSIAFIRIKGNAFVAADHIKRVINRLDPLYPVDITFYDAAFNALYQKERKTTALITIFSLLAVIISLVGVFGLVVFETQYRRKEIGVRKVLGATVAEVLGMFNRQFVSIVLVCFAVAAPLAWYGVTRWLMTFAYRTPIYWWVFAVSLAIVLFITLVTVTVQSWRAATANPVTALKSE